MKPVDQSEKHPETEVFLRNPSESDIARMELPTEEHLSTQSNRISRGKACAIEDNPPEGIDVDLVARLKNWERFCVLAIQVDPPAAADISQSLNAAIQALLAEMENDHQGITFHWKEGLYGGVFPGLAPDPALESARRFQAKLARTHGETVTIGIAQFPLNAFNRTQTLINACKALDHAAFFGPGSCAVFDAVSLNISGDQHYQAGEMGAAIAEYRAALRLDERNTNVLNSLGVCMAKINDTKAAREAFEKVLTIDPQETMALHNMGLVHMLEGDGELALTRLEQAYARDPRTFEIPFHLAKAYAGKREWSKAMEFIGKAIELRNESAQAYSLLGECLLGLERVSDAINAYHKAVKLNPNDSAALSALGDLYDRIGENPEICITFCRQSVHLAPGNCLFSFRLARLYHKYDYLDQALAEYERAVTLGQDCCQEIEQLRAQMMAAQVPKKCCA